MQTTDQRPAIILCLLMSVFALYTGFICIRMGMGHDVRPDLAVWVILAALQLLGATAARNSALRARASRAREEGLGATAYGRLNPVTQGRIAAGMLKHDDDPTGLDQALRRANAELDAAQAEMAGLLRFGAATGFDGRATPAQVDEASIAAAGLAPGGVLEEFDPPEFEEVPAPGNGDELLVEMVQELDDMLGEALGDPEGIAPDSRRTIGRVWRDLCIALGIEQATYAHRAPEAWDSEPVADQDDEAAAQ